MWTFQILTDGLADLPKAWVAAHPYLTVIDTPILISGKDNLTLRNLTPDDFWQVDQYVKQGDRATTSQPTIFDPEGEISGSVESITRQYLHDGKDVIYVTMSSFLSGAYNTALPCFERLDRFAKAHGNRALCVDSQCMSTGLALLLMELADFIDGHANCTVQDVKTFVETERGYIGHFFTWKELSYIRLSGRVSATKAILGTVLSVRLICSNLYNDQNERKLEEINHDNRMRVRGILNFARVLGMYAKMHIADPHGIIIVAHGNVPKDAQIIANTMREYLPDAQYLIGPEWRVGAGVQVHGGPTSIHVNFRTKEIGRLDAAVADVATIIHQLKAH